MSQDQAMAQDEAAWNALALACQQEGRLDDAEAAFLAALAVAPGSASACYNLAVLFLNRGKTAQALDLARQLVAALPEFGAAYLLQAIALHQLGQPTAAVASLAATPALSATEEAEFGRIGRTFILAGWSLPPMVWQRLLASSPEDVGLRLGYGKQLAKDGRDKEAVDVLSDLGTAYPEDAPLQCRLGDLLDGLGAWAQSQACYRRAIAGEPENAAAHNNLAMSLFLDGALEEAWEHHEWRQAAKELPVISWPGAPLTSSDISGCTLFLHGEQGLGDNIQFLRYARLLQRRGNRIVVGIRNELAAFFQRQDYVDTVIRDGEPLPAYDFHASLLSLPRLFGTVLSTIPAEIPYVAAEQSLVERWKALLASHQGHRVGVAWAGNPAHFNDANRSISAEVFFELFAVTGWRFFSLQQRWVFEQGTPDNVVDLAPMLPDLDELAAVLMNMDLVITVDSAIAHLAAALGRPVWILLPKPCDWRWLRGGERSPWYPKQVTLFRQSSPGDWPDVIARVAQRLDGGTASDDRG